MIFVYFFAFFFHLALCHLCGVLTQRKNWGYHRGFWMCFFLSPLIGFPYAWAKDPRDPSDIPRGRSRRAVAPPRQ